jgi:phosphate transport system protein
MDEQGIGRHISTHFNAELSRVFANVSKMGELVAAQILDGVEALLTGDSARGRRVAEGDANINAMEVDIDDECAEIIARRQPAAGDLRFVMAMTRTVSDLERMGDEAKRVGRIATELAPADDLQRRFVELAEMGAGVLSMLHHALDALKRMDAQAAARVVREDLPVDRAYEALLRQLVNHMMAEPQSIPRALNVMWAARSLERIGDRARNIGEHVIYVVRGKDVRHISIEALEREARAADTGPSRT